MQRVRGCASVAEPNQEAGPQEPEEDGVGAVCTAHGLENSQICTTHPSASADGPAGLCAALATGALAILSRPDVQVKLFSVHGFKKTLFSVH